MRCSSEPRGVAVIRRGHVMRAWFEELISRLSPGSTRAAPILHRKFRLSGEVLQWLGHPDRTDALRLSFVELLMKLDSNPVEYSLAVHRTGAPPGMRRASFEMHRVYFVWLPAEDRVSIILVR